MYRYVLRSTQEGSGEVVNLCGVGHAAEFRTADGLGLSCRKLLHLRPFSVPLFLELMTLSLVCDVSKTMGASDRGNDCVFANGYFRFLFQMRFQERLLNTDSSSHTPCSPL